MIFPIIKSNYGFLGEVICPTCRESYTHHLSIKSITRYHEDATRGTSVAVQGHHISFSNDAEKDNTSSRRDSVSIRFSCEQGCDDFTLSFSQHKGVTHFDCQIIKGAGSSWLNRVADDD